MDRAAKALIGQHDFSTFRDAECQARHPVRTLDKIDVARYGEGLEVTVEAKSFLHRQVRSIVGSLVEVGRGATIGAGSTISKPAAADALTLERARQRTLEGWERPVKKK